MQHEARDAFLKELSTMEAEHVALSSAMKELIPFQELFRGVASSIGLETSKTTFRTNVHEDNEGALTLAKLEPGRHTPRSKHYAINPVAVNFLLLRQDKSKFK